MNTIVFDDRAAVANTACFHCGLPVADGVRFAIVFDGRTRKLCCAGCEAVAATILQAGLSSYYRQRSAYPGSPAALVPDALRALEHYDLPGVREKFVGGRDANAATATLTLEGLNCAACAWLVERRLRALHGVLQADVNYATHRATVRWQAGMLPLSTILRASAAIGVPAYPADAGLDPARRNAARKRSLWEIFVAAFAMMQVMMYTVPLYLSEPGDVSPDLRQLMQWASFVLTIPVLLFSARPIFRGAWSALAAGVVGMDVPIALAILLTFVASTLALGTGSGEVYFDSIAMFVLLLLTARFIDAETRRRRLNDLESVVRPVPAVVERLAHYPQDRSGQQVATATLVAGDIVRVAAGAIVPADADVVEGAGLCDESLLSGESLPVEKRRGDTLVGGSINIGSPLIAEVTRTGAATVLAGLVRSSEAALAERPRLEKAVNRYAIHLSYACLLLAAAGSGAWLLIDPARAFQVAVAMLAITCPCALALAIPATTVSAAGAMARIGMIVQRGRWFDALAAVTDVVIDKTGTLTSGRMRVARVSALRGSADEALALAAALEQGSTHPIALAIRREAERRQLNSPPVTDIIAGPAGLTGKQGDAEWLLGKDAGTEAAGAGTYIALRKNGRIQAHFVLEDDLRADADAFIAALKAGGIRPHLLSGDLPSAVHHCAEHLLITDWRAGMSPDDKQQYVRGLQESGRVVLAIGDGVNDAPVLARADAGVAIVAGADLARARADAVLTGKHLMPVAAAIALARKARAIIRQNLAWAFAYNLVCLPLAAVGLVTPYWAAIGMSASSLLVVANAARLSRKPS